MDRIDLKAANSVVFHAQIRIGCEAQLLIIAWLEVQILIFNQKKPILKEIGFF
jgi:hypothetical protein